MVTPSNRLRRYLAWALVLGTVGWVAALIGAAYWATHSARQTPGMFASVTVYLLAGLICHQHADRSFHMWRSQLPVCARCTGLYLGAALGAVAALLAAYHEQWRRLSDRHGQSPSAWRIELVLAAAPTALTVALEKLLGVAITNDTRAWAGGLLGCVVAWMVISSLRGRGTLGNEVPGVNCSDASDDGGSDPAG